METCPLPTGPTNVGLPIVFKTSLTSSKTSCSPPTIIANEPSSAPIVPPETGASKYLIFLDFNLSLCFTAVVGLTELISMTVAPDFKFSKKLGLSITSSIAESLVSMVIITSLSLTTSSIEVVISAPNSFKGSALF